MAQGQTAEQVTKSIIIRRAFQRAVREETVQGHMIAMVRSVQGRWTLKLEAIREPKSGEANWFAEVQNHYPTDVEFKLSLTGPTSEHTEVEFQNAMRTLQSTMGSIKTGSAETKYRIHLVDGVTWKPMDATARVAQNASRPEGEVEYANVSMPPKEDLKVYFEGIYDADSQVNMVVRKIARSIEHDFQYRDHGLLIGDPGCGKSYTLMKAAQMFGDNAILKIDGTAMTSAGIIDILKDIPVMPRFVFIEEIDKAPNDAVAVLLGLMDKHGEIRKTTYRDKIQREARVCVFATANSIDKIQRMQEGALLSRFGNPIQYQRPDEAGLRRILHRELNDLMLEMCLKPTEQGSCGKCKPCVKRQKWIDATLDWCKTHQSEMMTDTMDPRFVITMCVEGGDDLLTGDYQRDLEATSLKNPEVYDFER